MIETQFASQVQSWLIMGVYGEARGHFMHYCKQSLNEDNIIQLQVEDF